MSECTNCEALIPFGAVLICKDCLFILITIRDAAENVLEYVYKHPGDEALGDALDEWNRRRR